MIASPAGEPGLVGKAGLVVCAAHAVENTAIAKAHADNNVLIRTSLPAHIAPPLKLLRSELHSSQPTRVNFAIQRKKQDWNTTGGADPAARRSAARPAVGGRRPCARTPALGTITSGDLSIAATSAT